MAAELHPQHARQVLVQRVLNGEITTNIINETVNAGARVPGEPQLPLGPGGLLHP